MGSRESEVQRGVSFRSSLECWWDTRPKIPHVSHSGTQILRKFAEHKCRIIDALHVSSGPVFKHQGLAMITEDSTVKELFYFLSDNGCTLQSANLFPRGWTLEIRSPSKGIFIVRDQPGFVQAFNACYQQFLDAPLRALIPTEIQKRILEDLSDENVSTRHTRTNLEQFKENRPAMLAAGWIALGDARAGKAHYVTEKGLAALRGPHSPNPDPIASFVGTTPHSSSETKKPDETRPIVHMKVVYGELKDFKSLCGAVRGENGKYAEDSSGVTCKRCLKRLPQE